MAQAELLLEGWVPDPGVVVGVVWAVVGVVGVVVGVVAGSVVGVVDGAVVGVVDEVGWWTGSWSGSWSVEATVSVVVSRCEVAVSARNRRRWCWHRWWCRDPPDWPVAAQVRSAAGQGGGRGLQVDVGGVLSGHHGLLGLLEVARVLARAVAGRTRIGRPEPVDVVAAVSTTVAPAAVVAEPSGPGREEVELEELDELDDSPDSSWVSLAWRCSGWPGPGTPVAAGSWCRGWPGSGRR